MEAKKRIAIFQYEWPIQSFSVNFITKLVEYGYQIDVFFKPLDGWDYQVTSFEKKLKSENINFYQFRTKVKIYVKIKNKISLFSNKIKFLFEIKSMIKRILTNIKYFDISNNFKVWEFEINPGMLERSINLIKDKEYKCFIGIEKKGLIWAGELGLKYNVPYLYYCLELYIEDHPEIHNFIHVREKEKKYHRSAKATIIQDQMRGECLLRSNGIAYQDLIFLPVSVTGAINKTKHNYFKSKFNIASGEKIVLYFGLIDKERMCTEIAQIACKLPEEYVTVFHGYGPAEYLNELKRLNNDERFIFSMDLVAEDEIIKIISSADIGLVLYDDSCSNNRLVAFSSEKLALFLQSGIPVIALNNESFRKLMNQFQCGELIDDISELPFAAERIIGNYQSYRENCYNAFKRYYNYDQQFLSVINYLENKL